MVPVLPRRPRTDYINPPERIARRTTAKRRGWYAGWPDDCPPRSARTELVVIRPEDGKIFSPEVDKRLADLFTAWLTYSQDVGYPLIGAMEENILGKKQGGIGSFYCRAIKGSDPPRPSNHSSATAVDLYTRSNPQTWGDPAKFISTIHPHMVELAAAADIYWGGWYWDARHDYVDAMHFEYMRRPVDVPDSFIRLKAKYDEIKERLKPEDPVNDEDVKLVQIACNQIGTTPPLVVDGVFGPVTRAAVANLPALHNSQIDVAEEATKVATKQAAVEAVEAV